MFNENILHITATSGMVADKRDQIVFFALITKKYIHYLP